MAGMSAPGRCGPRGHLTGNDEARDVSMYDKEKIGAHEIAARLRRHPTFLQQFPDLAISLVVPREQGSAASLAGYQLEILRDKNRELNRRLHELFANAQENERLAVRTHQLTLALMKQTCRADTCAPWPRAWKRISTATWCAWCCWPRWRGWTPPNGCRRWTRPTRGWRRSAIASRAANRSAPAAPEGNCRALR